jgi:hypothetical protein
LTGIYSKEKGSSSKNLKTKEMKKINKIISGVLAVTFFVTAATQSNAQLSSKNRVAIMPMAYIGDGDDERDEEMRYVLQDIAVNYMNRSAAELKFMDVAEVNALLYKKGINEETIRGYTPKELAAILNVEYVIIGSVLQDKGSVVTVTNQHTTRRQTVEHYDRYGRHGRHRNYVEEVNRNNNNRRSETRQNIETQVSLSIYNEDGEKIYSKSRQSILTEQDAYKNAIQYLLKRTPLYKR